MPPESKRGADRIRLRHMLDAVTEALRFARGKSRKDLRDDRMLTLALIKDLEIIGEAAGRVSKRFQVAHKEIPWANMVGARNRLIHGYFDVDIDIVWETVRSDLPALAKVLKTVFNQKK
ncbi:MAG: DUF86 domain-containing protein [Pseudomonadota bacterium]